MKQHSKKKRHRNGRAGGRNFGTSRIKSRAWREIATTRTSLSSLQRFSAASLRMTRGDALRGHKWLLFHLLGAEASRAELEPSYSQRVIPMPNRIATSFFLSGG